MAKDQNFSKNENEKRRLQKQKEKEQRRQERQANKGQSGDDWLAYVDENGNITSTPPDPTKRREIDVESIQIGVPKQENRPVENPVRQGVVTFFNTSKGYGFIKDQSSQESIFVHANNLGGLTITEGDKVSFETEPGMKGPTAVRVKKGIAGA